MQEGVRDRIISGGNELTSKQEQEAKFKKWEGWLEIIHEDIRELLVRKYIFQEVQDIIKSNPKIHKPSSFYDWLSIVHSVDISIGIRRQLDANKKSVSFTRLLTEIIEEPEVLSRERFVGLYPDEEYRRDYGHKDFDDFAGKGNAYIYSELVQTDLNDLRESGKDIREFANKRVAHYSENSPSKPVTDTKVVSCLDLLEKLLIKYELLFHAATYDGILPVWQYDWKEIFREPWIPLE